MKIKVDIACDFVHIEKQNTIKYKTKQKYNINYN